MSSETARDRSPDFYATSACPTGKRAYVTRVAAHRAAKRASKRSMGHMRPYRCAECDRWHIGHLPGSRSGHAPE